jgi:hypothetical protein
MSSTAMASAIIKGSPTSCCSVGLRKLVGTVLYNVATGWVASCVTTIKRLHELAGQSRQMAVRLRPAPRSGLIVVGKRWPPTNSRVPPTFPCATGRLTYRAVTDWDSDKTQINFCIEQTGPTDHYFDHTGWREDFCPCMQARCRGHRIEAPGAPLPGRAEQDLAQDQESGGAGRAAFPG